MTIESKFAPKYTVFFMNENRVTEGEIKEIHSITKCDEISVETKIFYKIFRWVGNGYGGYVEGVPEDMVFGSRDELIKNLIGDTKISLGYGLHIDRPTLCHIPAEENLR